MKTKSEKVDINNAVRGELAHQFEVALKKAAENIENYGDAAEHEINIKVILGKNLKQDFWEIHSKTVTSCKLKETQIGGRAAIKIEKGAIYDDEKQQDLPLAKPA
jgi:hypothetical protein